MDRNMYPTQTMMNHNKAGSIIKLQMSLQNQWKHKNILQNKYVPCCLLYGIVMNCKEEENRVGVRCITSLPLPVC